MDGTCVIAVFHKDGVQADNATIGEIINSVWLVEEFCLRSRLRRPQGGFLRDIGGLVPRLTRFFKTSAKQLQGENKNLAVVLSRYYPQVSYFGTPFPIRYSGRTFGDSIPTSFEQQIFGPVGRPGIQLGLPRTFMSKGLQGSTCLQEKK